MKKIVICFAISFLCFFVTDLFAKSYSDKKPAAQQNVASDVVLYVTKRCGYCVRAKKFFRANGVAFQAIDIDQSAEGRKQFKALGGKGVPLIIIGEKKIRGFNQSAIKKALGI